MQTYGRLMAYKIVFGIMSTDIAKYFKLNTDVNYLNLVGMLINLLI